MLILKDVCIRMRSWMNNHYTDPKQHRTTHLGPDQARDHGLGHMPSGDSEEEGRIVTARLGVTTPPAVLDGRYIRPLWATGHRHPTTLLRIRLGRALLPRKCNLH
jgi:hypothetical protein